MNDKKKMIVAVAGITSALLKGYELLNEEGQMPEISKEDLPQFGYQIVRGLKKEISLLEDNARFEGMNADEIHDKKEQERAEALELLQAESAEQLKKLKPKPEPAPDPESDPATDQAVEPGGSESDPGE